ncbi:MAG: hypothetical protein ACLRQ0_11425 [Monoglobales bacterium]
MLLNICSNRSHSGNIVIVNENGKIGLSKVENDTTTIICSCEYDTIEIIDSCFFLVKDDTVCCYNSVTDKINSYKEVILDLPYFYARDEEYQYIILTYTGEILYRKELNKYNKSEYVCLGNTIKRPVFYDMKYSTYLYPDSNGYRVYPYPINYPIIINGYNVIDVVEMENGIGVIDPFGNHLTDSECEEISLELKITAVNKESRTEKTIPLPNSIYRRN